MKFLKMISAAVLAMMCGVSVSAANLVFDPSVNDNWYARGVFYGRGIQLVCDEAGECKGNLYATCEYNYYPGMWGRDHFPIFESCDGGKTWTHISDVREYEFQTDKWKKAEDGTYYEVPLDTEGAGRYLGDWWTLVFQPQLFELKEDLGGLKRGTVICAGVTKGERNSAIVLHYSTDNLRNWKYLSAVAFGGKSDMEIGQAIWEPFFVQEKGILYCFFSDERGMTKGGGQRIVFSKSADGINWSEKVDVCDFEEENSKYRPGMPVVTRLPDGRWFMVYEGVNMGDPHPVYYKITDDIEQWRPEVKYDGVMPAPFNGGSPFCTTLKDGTVVVGAHGTHKIAVNTDSLKTDSWMIVDVDIKNGYSRSLFPLEDGRLLIVSGGPFSGTVPSKLEAYVKNVKIPGEIDLDKAVVTGTDPWGEEKPNFDNSAKNVTDKNPDTFFDGRADGYFIIDLGEEYTITGLGYQARKGFGFRVKGGMFYGSVDGENWTKIYTIPSNNDMMNYNGVREGKYRYVKYTSDGVNGCNIGEIRLYSRDIVKLNVGGVVLDYKERGIFDEGVMLLPLRLVSEAMGCEVGWIGEEKSATVTIDGKTITLPIGEKTYSVDGVKMTSSAKTQLVGSATYIPVDVIEKAMGKEVTVNENNVYIK